MHFVYIDDSRDEEMCVFSALTIPAAEWRAAFGEVRKFRRDLKASDGIYVYKELHAWKFVSGRGRISDRVVTKYRRAQIFGETLELVATLPGVRLMNAICKPKEDIRAFERLTNRINTAAVHWGSHAVLISDEGKEADYTRLIRKMGVYNPIPSALGGWPEGPTRNIPIERVLEDIVFKSSQRSYFIQLVDFCAYALLRRERPVPSRTKYGIDKGFAKLDPILHRPATRYDPEGILRL